MTEALYRRTESDQGLKIISEEMPWVRSVTVGIWVQTGSVYESDQQAGISHMLEHMVFKSTAKRTGLEIVQAIEGVGGHINAFTSKELTCYYAQVLDTHLDLALDVISDLLISPTLAHDDVEREKLVITEEIRHYEDTPHELIFDYFAEILYGKHPMARPIMGSVESVQSLSNQQLHDYLERYYSRDRMVVAATGNLDHNDLVMGIDERLSRISQSRSARIPQLKYPRPKTKTYSRSVQGVHFCRGVPGVSFKDKRKMATLILSNLLGGGMSSRLFQRVREEEGLAYNVYSYMDAMRNTGVFGVYVGTDPNRFDQVIAVLNEEYQRILDEGIPEEEIERVKEQLKGNLMLGLEGTSGRMFRLAKLEIYLERFLTLDETIGMIDAVTVDDVMTLASELLEVDKQYGAVIIPNGK